ncbi:uncharacterized protein TNCV_1950121 [Trichonephila clavipes]|nr:uncharacterized protein TNCV_1950121 [Trichonephila clavipes]
MKTYFVSAYLKYAPCYKNVSVAEEKCAPKYRHLIELTENVSDERDVDEGLKESCCAFRDFVLCKYKYVSRDCGHDAAEFLERHLDRITSPLLHEHCAHYTYGDGTCSAMAKIQQPLQTIIFMLAISLLVDGILRRFWDADAING